MKVFKNKIARLLTFLFGKKPKNVKDIPIIINNYNRLTTLQGMINTLEKRGYYNIHILDNQSTYKPLLEFYKKTSHKVYHLKDNYGAKALWKSGLWSKFRSSYYVYTDADLSLVDECPDDFLKYFYELLQKYPKVHKVGFSLKIDDLPDFYKNKQQVIDWETKFFSKQKEPNVFIAPIDTTFALYRPFSRRGARDGSTEMLRTGFPYEVRHMPWYLDSENLSKEEAFYVNSLQKKTHWSSQS